jgi:hypothetical protein
MSEKQWVLFRRYVSNQSRQSAADAVRGHRLLRSVRLRGHQAHEENSGQQKDENTL